MMLNGRRYDVTVKVNERLEHRAPRCKGQSRLICSRIDPTSTERRRSNVAMLKAVMSSDKFVPGNSNGQRRSTTVRERVSGIDAVGIGNRRWNVEFAKLN